MAIKFIPARELKARYYVLGHFYEIVLNSNMRIRCRSALEILTKENAIGINDAERGLPDAIFIMMNPGSSRPLDGSPPEIKRHCTIADDKLFVPTRPDTTQYQVMRVMYEMGWGRVRVLNLSDIREPKSKVFVTTLQSLGYDQSVKNHSVFAPSRRNELDAELLRKTDAPLVCAWGVSSQLDSLIDVAAPALSAAGVCRGIPKAGEPGKYFHPLPARQIDKEAWVTKMCKELGLDA